MNNDFMAIFSSPAAGASETSFFAAAASKSPDEPAGPSFADVLADSADEAGLRETRGDGTPDVRAESAPEPPASEQTFRRDGGDEVFDPPMLSAVPAPDSKIENPDRRFLFSGQNMAAEAASGKVETGVQAGKHQASKKTTTEARAESKEGKTAKPEAQVKTATESPDRRLHVASREIRPANEVSSHAASALNSGGEATMSKTFAARDAVAAGATAAAVRDAAVRNAKAGKTGDSRFRDAFSDAAKDGAAASTAAESIGRQTHKRKSSTIDAARPEAGPAVRKKAVHPTAVRAEDQKPVGEKIEVSAHPQITPTKSADAGITEGSGDEKTATLVSRLRQQGQQNVDATGAGAPARVGSTSAGAEGMSLEQTWTGRTADVPADVLRQVTDRIGAQLRSGASEMRLALKPESLGHLNLSISTDHNGVSVRIVAETAAARDLIETQLGQLRNDLTQQGLDVKALEVGVFTANDDSRRDAQGQPYSGRSGSARLAKEPQNDVAAVSPAVVQRWEDGRQRLVGIYA